MSNILFLTFYYQPDLSAGSFRNTLLANVLSDKLKNLDERAKIIIITTLPNRYNSYNTIAPVFEENGNLVVHRINIGKHKGGFLTQAFIFYRYWKGVFEIQRQYNYCIIYASSSRLMTAFLGACIKVIRRKKVDKLFLDIRDIFRESISEVLGNRIIKYTLNGLLKVIERFTFRQSSIINVVTPEMTDYFRKFGKEVTCFSNGVDDIFFDFDFSKTEAPDSGRLKITFAGNIGKAQALHKVLPDFAKRFSNIIDVYVVGDGSSREDLITATRNAHLDNFYILPPVSRDEILIYYKESDYLFLHLDDKKAFYKAIPSKLFEYAATRKPIIAGLKGKAKAFAEENIENILVFDSNDTACLIKRFEQFEPQFSNREEFLRKYRRTDIMRAMSIKILN